MSQKIKVQQKSKFRKGDRVKISNRTCDPIGIIDTPKSVFNNCADVWVTWSKEQGRKSILSIDYRDLELMPVQRSPKFKIGDKVKHLPTLYKETAGIVEEVERIYQTIFENGEFDWEGLSTLEHTIPMIQLPYTFDGETLIIEFPEHDYGKWIEKAHTHVSKFSGYGVTVRTPEMLSVFNEQSLKLIP